MKKTALISVIALSTVLIFIPGPVRAIGPGGAGDSVERPTLSSSKYSVGLGEPFTLNFHTTSELPGDTEYTLCATNANGTSCLNKHTICPTDNSKCKKKITTDKNSYSILPVPGFAAETFYYMVKANVYDVDSVYSKVVKIEYKPTAKIPLSSSDKYPVSNNKYTLNWSCNNCQVDYYILYKSKDSTFSSGIEKKTFPCYDYTMDPINCTSTTLKILEPGTYYYKVKAYDFDVNSLESGPITIKVRSAYWDSPKAREMFAGEKLHLAWIKLSNNISDVKGYEICTGFKQGACYAKNCDIYGSCWIDETTSRTLDEKPLEKNPIFSENKVYYYALRVSYQDGGYSDWSNEKKVTIKPLRPELDVKPKTVDKGKTVLLKWGKVSKAEYYDVCMSDTPGGSCSFTYGNHKDNFKVTWSGKRAYYPPAQEPLVTRNYYYRVRTRGANKDKQISPWSNEVTVKVKTPDPGLTPAHPFYVIDTLLEKTSLLLTLSSEGKAKKAMGYAQERLAEAQMMVVKNETKGIEKAVEGYAAYVDLAVDKIGKVKDVVKKDELLIDASKNIYEQQLGLDQLLEDAPDEYKESVTNALEVNKGSLERSLEVIPERKDEVQIELNRIEKEFELSVPDKSAAPPELEPLIPLKESETFELNEQESEEIRITPGIPKVMPEPEPEPEPEVQETSKPVPKPEIQKVIEPMQKPEVQKVTEPASKPVIQEVTEPTPKPAIRETSKPAPEPVIRETSKPAPEPEVQTITKPALEPEPVKPKPSAPECGNNTCETGESQSNCCGDCGCPEHHECQNNECVAQTSCGDGVCNEGESCSNCDADCPAQCCDLLDNDDDSLTDYPDDPGCSELCDEDEIDEIACHEDFDCSDGNPCNIYFCENMGTVDSHCSFDAEITECYEDEFGCCPAGCTHANDSNCELQNGLVPIKLPRLEIRHRFRP